MCDYFVISTLTGKREIDSTFFSIFSFKEIFFFFYSHLPDFGSSPIWAGSNKCFDNKDQ